MNVELAQKIVDTTQELLTSNGLHGWEIELGNAARVAGSCHYRNKVIRISMKLAQVSPWAEVHDTIMHEVAHAIAGAAAGHGPEWRRVARSLGIRNPQARSGGVDTSSIDPWKGTCPNGHTMTRAGAPRRVRSCGRCSPQFSTDHLVTWTKHGETVPMPTAYQRELTALLGDLVPA